MSSILGIIAFILLLQWDKGSKFKIKDLVVKVLFLGGLLIISNLIGAYLKNTGYFSIPFIKLLPENVTFWFGAVLFFAVCCAFSVNGWTQSINKKENSLKD
ncbi:hypothetical protein [Neobacillus soli]|uniref:hypothetical protein n=1 Tax=Neobacillus soli TaxID=220688 RepID=UPI0008256C5B|nr:hypothetical protein [Neobacillus soli]